MIAVMDYGAGNLGSVYKALRYVGADVQVTADPAAVARASHLVLPGVGAFSHCMRGLEAIALADASREFIASGRPFLGICVGLQMLFDTSEEMGETRGLGILPGRVRRFRFDGEPRMTDDGRRVTDDKRAQPPGGGETPDTRYPVPGIEHRAPDAENSAPRLKVPHIGWNDLRFRADAPLFAGLRQGDRAYFVHSYYPEPTHAEIVSATTRYGIEFCCAVQRDNVHATQFHPEKSGEVGLQILRNFASLPA